MSDSTNELVHKILPEVVALRRDLHAHPELSFDVDRTAGRVAEVLDKLDGVEVRTGVGKTGVIGTLRRDAAGPTVALRADMDALPIAELTGLPYASTVSGCMHACGHDGHTSCLIGTAMVLAQMADRLTGPVRFIFQPAEETDGGARYMCEDGALEDPHVSAIFALHGWPELPLGHIGLKPGPAMAASNPFSIRVRGRGGHAASPHRTVDPIVVASRIVDGLQSIVSRTAKPGDPAVVTVGQFQAGTAPNIIPDEALLEGTIRTVQADTRERVVHNLRQIAEHTAQAHGATADVDLIEGYPSLHNDPGLTNMVANVGRDVLGAECVHTNLPITLGTEDFAYYAQRVPGVMIRLGLRPASAQTYPSLHTPAFNFNDDALPVGMRLLAELIFNYEARLT